MSPESSLLKNESAISLVRTILLVEDEDLIRMCMSDFLLDCGYHIMEAGNVAHAKRILLDQDVDLVFSDINMPGPENGFALEQWIRSHFPRTKVLLTSGFPHPLSATRGLLEPLILKPYTGNSVVKRIQRLLSAQ